MLMLPVDPIKEIHAIREAIMREFDYDLDKYCEYLSKQPRDGRTYVTPEPKRIKRNSDSKAIQSAKRKNARKKSGKRKKSA